MGEHAAARKPSARGKEPPNALVEARRRRDRDSQAGRTSASRGAKGLRAVPAEKPAAVRKAAGLTGTGYGVLGVTLVMFLFGMVMIFSASSGLALNTHGSSYYFLLRQAIWFAVGLVALAALAYTDYHRVAEFSPALAVASLVLLAAVPLIGTEAYGSKRSIVLGPIVVQPSEIAKMALLIFAVYIYSRRKDRLESWRELIMPVLAVTALACLLIILEPDLGSMLVVAISVYAVLWLAGTPLRKMALLGLLGGSATLLFIFTSGYRKARFFAFLDPWSAPREGGFHIIQSMIALGSGNISGLGLGMSRQKFFYLPNAHTDFIFSIIGEEAGLIGTLCVLGLFAVFIYMGCRIAKNAPDRLGRLLAMGIVCMLGVQALINMGGASGVLPITGITLPFFSYGGSSLVICMCLAGILINVSRHEGGAGASHDGRNKRERGDMRRRNRRPSPSPARPGGGTRIA
ncbi:MAG: putative lipid II flippase FtsW [Actinomycetota bacterium]|nr:putative lipid II flippase FtsW [Actinomycetota bacterium]MDD5666871.1 putative lipid II flippase FtsW [Actinomycetota bacterium]